MPAKLIGLAFLAAAWLIRRDVKRAQARGHVGPAHRRVWREEQRWRFRGTITVRVVGVAVCLVAAYLCFTGAHTE